MRTGDDWPPSHEYVPYRLELEDPPIVGIMVWGMGLVLVTLSALALLPLFG